MIVYKNMFQGSTSNFESTCSIGQETVKFYLYESENYLSASETYLSGSEKYLSGSENYWSEIYLLVTCKTNF